LLEIDEAQVVSRLQQGNNFPSVLGTTAIPNASKIKLKIVNGVFFRLI